MYWASRLFQRDTRVPIRMTLHANLLLSVLGTVQRSERDYADSFKYRSGVKVANLAQRGAGEMTQLGIIRNAALYSGNGPATVELFRNLWGVDALPKIQAPRQIGQQSSLFDRS